MTMTTNLARASLGLVGIAAVGMLTSGCSQVVGLASQGNMNVIYLATASTDVLTAKQIPIQQAPRCTVDADKLYTCEGTAADGRPILVLVPENDTTDPQMTITVGEEQIYSGSVLTVLDDAAQVAQ